MVETRGQEMTPRWDNGIFAYPALATTIFFWV